MNRYNNLEVRKQQLSFVLSYYIKIRLTEAFQKKLKYITLEQSQTINRLHSMLYVIYGYILYSSCLLQVLERIKISENIIIILEIAYISYNFIFWRWKGFIAYGFSNIMLFIEFRFYFEFFFFLQWFVLVSYLLLVRFTYNLGLKLSLKSYGKLVRSMSEICHDLPLII